MLPRSGAEPLAQNRTERYHPVVAGTDGLELCQRIWQLRAEVQGVTTFAKDDTGWHEKFANDLTHLEQTLEGG